MGTGIISPVLAATETTIRNKVETYWFDALMEGAVPVDVQIGSLVRWQGRIRSIGRHEIVIETSEGELSLPKHDITMVRANTGEEGSVQLPRPARPADPPSRTDLQHLILARYLEKKTSLVLHLVSKQAVIGTLIDYDNYTLLIRERRQRLPTLLYKHGVATLQSAAAPQRGTTDGSRPSQSSV
ncbi:MAG: RNA chaperone Hfq [Nitrospirota bacterium]